MRAAVCLACLSLSVPVAGAQDYPDFESPQARSIAVSADGSRLYAVNTPGNSLAVWSIARPASPLLLAEIPVGLEPVSVAVHSATEVWVVNHVSDSVSVVDTARGVVVATIRIGDEPGDVVFSGTPKRAFITSMTERAVVVVDPTTRQRVATIPVFGDDPRALLASPGGKTVWVAISRSGNKTTVVPHTIAPPPPPPTNKALPPAPKQGIIVRSDDPAWKAKLGVKLPDSDLVEIDAATLRVRRSYAGVGTILFNLALRPGTRELWVANTEARNKVRFEPALRGHIIDSRITRVATGLTPSVRVVDLNPGIDYGKLPNAAALASALSQPTDVAFDPAGKTAYVAAFGTDRIGVLDVNGKVTSLIEVGDTRGTKVAPRTKRGPRALAHHPRAALLYVLNRLSNSIAVVDTAAARVVRELAMFDPTPRPKREGRGFLFDAKLSGNGTASCASCHVDGRHDGLAWDLGNPGGNMVSNGSNLLHPMKGPLLTQTLQGLGSERIFHWRADRPGLATFNGAFADLMGGSRLAKADLDAFVAYMKTIRFMPNPNRELDDTLPSTPVGESARDGRAIFMTKPNVGRDGPTQFRCIECHAHASGSGGFGFTGLIGQPTKAAQLRGLYKRDGRKPVAGSRTAGFGFGADGSKDDLAALLSTTSRFNPLTAKEKRALARFLFAFPTRTAPVVGFSRTVDASNLSSVEVARDVNLLLTQAHGGRCDVIAKGRLGGLPTGLVYNPRTLAFDRDRRSAPPLTLSGLAAALAQRGATVTLLGVPPGFGRQLGIDRDTDGVFDGDASGAHYGRATPACATPLLIRGNSAPRLGNAGFAVVVTGAQKTTGGVVLLAPRRGHATLGDITLLVDPAATTILPLLADRRGTATAPLPVPADPKLAGAWLRLQGVMPAACGNLGLAASAGFELQLLR